MKIITSKTIKNFILNPTNDLDELFDYIEDDYKSTIDGIFSALYKLLIRNYEQNKSRSDYIINVLENLSEDLVSDQLIYLNGSIENINNNIRNNLKKKQIIPLNRTLNRLNELHNKNANMLVSEEKNSKLKVLEYLIFADKNLYFIERTINANNRILMYKNNEGEDILTILLKRYLYLNDQDVEEIEYLYNVILLFVESKMGHEILSNKNKYKRIIKQSKLEYKEHVIRIIELFDPNFRITYEELEQRYNMKFEFPGIIFNELNTFKMDNEGRINFTNQNCITIDGENDKCLDDALYIEENLDGSHTYYIHIADIPSFIPYSSAVDEEARGRTQTFYLRDRHINLYPELISDRLCSLLPNNNRNVITYIYKLDSKCELVSEFPEIVKGKIRVVNKMSYDEVDRRVKNLTNNEIDIMLGRLFLFSLNQKKSNPNKELYRKLENYLEFKPHHESLKVDYSPAANIVHEAMILTNYGASSVFRELDLPYVYRQLYIPTNDFIDRQIKTIKNLDAKIGNTEAFRNNLKSSYSKATYTSKPVYHKGQNLSSYSHSSSPLRRYPDAYCQYLIYKFLFSKNFSTMDIDKWAYRTEELVKYINNRNEEMDNFSRHYNYLSYKKLIKKK